MDISIKKPSSLTEQGQREINEDSIYPKTSLSTVKDRLFIICDGLGGLKFGEVASGLACESLADYMQFESDFSPEKAMRFVEMRFSDFIDLSPGYAGMATTMVFLYIRGKDVIIGWVGDSRAYHIRNGKILFQTEDHSLVNELVKEGKLRPNKARFDSRRHIVTRVVGNPRSSIKLDYKILPDIKKGDFFFLCTDGILENIDDGFIKKHFLSRHSPAEIRDTIKKTCSFNTQDNYSMYIVQVA